jgi:hypothetical protein
MIVFFGFEGKDMCDNLKDEEDAVYERCAGHTPSIIADKPP